MCNFCSDVSPEMLEGFNFPESYRVNSTKEKLALSYAENFRKQFVHLYRDRKPLLLNPVNELQVEVCAAHYTVIIAVCSCDFVTVCCGGQFKVEPVTDSMGRECVMASHCCSSRC